MGSSAVSEYFLSVEYYKKPLNTEYIPRFMAIKEIMNITVEELSKLLKAEIICGDGGKKITAGYCGDFLSFTVSRAPSCCAWFTVISNVNVAAVALLAEVSAVVLCEGIRPDEALVARCGAEGIGLMVTALSVFGAAVLLGGLNSKA